MASKFYMKVMFIFALAMMAAGLFLMVGVSSSDAAFKKKGIRVLAFKDASVKAKAQLRAKPLGLVASSPVDFFLFSDLEWKTWGNSEAEATGRVKTSLQDPAVNVRMRLSHPTWCGGYRLYTKARLVEWEGSSNKLHNRPVTFYRCSLGIPEMIPNGFHLRNPSLVGLTRKLIFEMRGWKGYGSRRVVARSARKVKVCGWACYRPGPRAKVFGSNIRFCQGTLVYTRITARWAGKKRVVQLGAKWCRQTF